MEECPKVYTTGDPTVNFEQEASQMEDEEGKDVGLPPELERIIS